MNSYKAVLLLLFGLAIHHSFAQDTDEQTSKYDQYKTFSPLFYPDKGNGRFNSPMQL